MIAFLGDLALLGRDNAVALAHNAQAVGDDDHGTALRDQFQVALHDLLALRIQRRGCLAKDQDTRVGYQRAGDGSGLALVALEVAAALVDLRVIALGQFQDKLVRARRLCRLHDLALRQGRVGQPFHGYAHLLKILPHLQDAEHRLRHPPRQHVERHQRADAQVARDHHRDADMDGNGNRPDQRQERRIDVHDPKENEGERQVDHQQDRGVGGELADRFQFAQPVRRRNIDGPDALARCGA